MAGRLLFLLAVAALAFGFGWLHPPSVDQPVAAVRRVAVRDVAMAPAGLPAATAAVRLAELNRPPPPPAPPKPPPPPPPDPAVTLRAAVAAVVQDGEALQIVLTAGSNPRTLRIGDTFAGWRVAAISRQQAVLQRGGEQRIVSFFSPSAGV